MSRVVFFIEEYSKGKFPFAIYLDLGNKINSSQVRFSLTEFFKKRGIKYKNTYINNKNIISTKLKEKDENFIINFLISDNGIAITNRIRLIKRYLNKNYDSGYIKNLLADSSFANAYKKSLTEGATPFSVAAVIFNSKLSFLPPKVKNIVFNQSIDKNGFYINKLVLPRKIQEPSERQIIEALRFKNNHTNTFPEGVCFSTNINKLLLDILLQNVSATKYSHMFDIDNLNLIIQYPSDLKVPGIAIVLNNVKNHDNALRGVKNLLSDFLEVQAYKWERKNFNGLQGEYNSIKIMNGTAMLPANIGLNLVYDDNDLILSNSENLVIDLLSSYSKDNAKRMEKMYRINNESAVNLFMSPHGIANSMPYVLSRDFGKNISQNMTFSFSDFLILLSEMPDFNIDIFYTDDAIIYECKMVLN